MDPVPEGNTRKPEVKDYVDVKKQAAKLGHPNPATQVCLHHLLNRYFISPDMAIISVQCSICKEGYGNDTISQAKHTWEDFAESNGHYISVCSACQLSILQEILVHKTWQNGKWKDLMTWREGMS